MAPGQTAVRIKSVEGSPDHGFCQRASLCQLGRYLPRVEMGALVMSTLLGFGWENSDSATRFCVGVPFDDSLLEAFIECLRSRGVKEMPHVMDGYDDALSGVIPSQIYTDVTTRPIVGLVRLMGRRYDRCSLTLVAARFTHGLSLGERRCLRKRSRRRHYCWLARWAAR